MQSTTKSSLMEDQAHTYEATSPAATPCSWLHSLIAAQTQHWPEYLMEAAGLGLFMISACTFAVILDHPASFVRNAIPNSFVRRTLGGIAMGLTAIGLNLFAVGQTVRCASQPSPHPDILPSRQDCCRRCIFLRFLPIRGWSSGRHVQCSPLGGTITDQNIRYAATLPGSRGAGIAFAAEVAISFLLMTVVLNASNSARWASLTGVFAGVLVALYISLEAPLSGMSMNPARTFASAFSGRIWNALWVYFTAPPLGMLLAAELYLRTRGKSGVFCAKLHHDNHQRCIFRCNYQALKHQSLILKEMM
jgi:aquaporin Z